MKQYGLIGKSLKHSFSQSYFEEKFAKEKILDCQYELFELDDIQQLPTVLHNHPYLEGFNVTIPYKQSIIPFLDELDLEAEQVGAVNTVRVLRSGQQVHTKGFNTDIIGFRESLVGKILPPKALILGTGGAAAAVSHVLDQEGITCQFVSRSERPGTLTYEALTPDIIREHKLIVNCTPIGTMENQCPPLPYAAIGADHFLYDLVYNPAKTKFLEEGEKRHATIQSGLQMLHLQADAAWNIWQTNKR